MPQESWTQLCGYAFGHIIFPIPKQSTVPLPIIVGEGDLDGGDYCVCWDDDVIKALLPPTLYDGNQHYNAERRTVSQPEQSTMAYHWGSCVYPFFDWYRIGLLSNEWPLLIVVSCVGLNGIVVPW
jgi:hypothetical protein